MMITRNFRELPHRHGLLGDVDDDRTPTVFTGFLPGGEPQHFASGKTHFGVVRDGSVLLTQYVNGTSHKFELHGGMYFACPGACDIRDINRGDGVVASCLGYKGLFQIGGPLRGGEGQLRYIDGGSTTLIVAPLLKGDPCLNHLHFPAGHKQTRHTHPSFRFTIVLSGSGKCTIPANADGTGTDVECALEPGCMFIIPTGGFHAIDAVGNQALDVVTFHPETIIGWTDDYHPMLESTFLANKMSDGSENNDPRATTPGMVA